MTGLTADTVRVWERRYGAVRPDRTDGNARRYTDREVKRLILLREATSRGHAIGEIANLDEPELVKLVRGEEQLAVQTRTYDTLVEEIIRHVEAFEPRRVHEVFVRAAATLPPARARLRPGGAAAPARRRSLGARRDDRHPRTRDLGPREGPARHVHAPRAGARGRAAHPLRFTRGAYPRVRRPARFAHRADAWCRGGVHRSGRAVRRDPGGGQTRARLARRALVHAQHERRGARHPRRGREEGRRGDRRLARVPGRSRGDEAEHARAFLPRLRELRHGARQPLLDAEHERHGLSENRASCESARAIASSPSA
jgi:DNA-binding transcriptional MerR regulator